MKFKGCPIDYVAIAVFVNVKIISMGMSGYSVIG